jgi:hypothetical protein
VLVLIYLGCLAITVALIVWLVPALTTGEGGRLLTCEVSCRNHAGT